MPFSVQGTLGVSLPNVPFTNFPDLGRAFTTGFVIEIVEKKTIRRTIDAHVFVINPSRYVVSEPFEATLTPTEANTVIEEVNGIIVREITLEGTFGLKDRTPKKVSLAPSTLSKFPPLTKTAPAIKTNGQADGNTSFKALRDLFRNYSDIKKDPEHGPFTKMVFHSLRDDDHWTVVPKSFETPRDASKTRMHYEYKISLLTTGDATKLYAIPDDSFGLDDAFRIVNQGLNEARSFVSDINATKAQIKRKIANIDAIMINVSGLLTQIGVAVSNNRELVIDYPKRLAKSAAEDVTFAAQTMAQAVSDNGGSQIADIFAERNLRKLEGSLDRILSQPHKFKESSQEVRRRIEQSYLGELALTADDLATNTGGATANSTARITGGTESEAGTSFGEYSSLQRVQVTAITTLDLLSTVYNVSKELIVIINDLKPPYFTRGGGLGTLKPGDFLLMPAQDTGNALGSAPDPSYRNVEQTLYGLDFALDPVLLERGKLDFLTDSGHGNDDAQYVTGIPNVTNGLQIILHSEQGETQHVPDVGLSMPVGGKGTLQNVLIAATSMRNSILSDDRIERIVSSRLVLEGDTLNQEITPQIRGAGEGLTVVLPLGRATGG